MGELSPHAARYHVSKFSASLQVASVLSSLEASLRLGVGSTGVTARPAPQLPAVALLRAARVRELQAAAPPLRDPPRAPAGSVSVPAPAEKMFGVGEKRRASAELTGQRTPADRPAMFAVQSELPESAAIGAASAVATQPPPLPAAGSSSSRSSSPLQPQQQRLFDRSPAAGAGSAAGSGDASRRAGDSQTGVADADDVEVALDTVLLDAATKSVNTSVQRAAALCVLWLTACLAQRAEDQKTLHFYKRLAEEVRRLREAAQRMYRQKGDFNDTGGARSIVALTAVYLVLLTESGVPRSRNSMVAQVLGDSERCGVQPPPLTDRLCERLLKWALECTSNADEMQAMRLAIHGRLEGSGYSMLAWAAEKLLYFTPPHEILHVAKVLRYYTQSSVTHARARVDKTARRLIVLLHTLSIACYTCMTEYGHKMEVEASIARHFMAADLTQFGVDGHPADYNSPKHVLKWILRQANKRLVLPK